MMVLHEMIADALVSLASEGRTTFEVHEQMFERQKWIGFLLKVLYHCDTLKAIIILVRSMGCLCEDRACGV